MHSNHPRPYRNSFSLVIKDACIDIPLETWSRVQQTHVIKSLFRFEVKLAGAVKQV
jgi:hypothetical protein